MDKSRQSNGNGSYMDQNSLGILNMDNLKGKRSRWITSFNRQLTP